jgi:hypothetical protein
MSKAKSVFTIFAAVIALGATLDAQARGQGGGMSGQGMGHHGGQGKRQQDAQGSGDMTQERTRTRDMSQERTRDMEQDVQQRREMRQERRQTQQAASAGGAITQ